MIQLETFDAEHVKWQIEEAADQLQKAEAAARRRGVANVVSKKGQDYFAEALHRARAELVKAYAGINPTRKEANHVD